MKKTTIKETEFPMNVLIELFHEGTADWLRRNLKANLGFGNGIEDHINDCPNCQAKLNTLAANLNDGAR